jgi:hypothetical protein
MLSFRNPAQAALFSCALLFAASFAEADTFIASNGNDANPCTRTAPCRTLQRGVNATPNGQELTILTSGSLLRATIAKSITINAEGVVANIRSYGAGGTAILINHPTARVVLRNLIISGGVTGGNGIHIADAQSVHIEDCEIERFAGFGIAVDVSDVELFVDDTISRMNGADGLAFNGNGTSGRLTVDNSRFENNGDDGMEVQGIIATVANSVFSGNGENGVEVSFGRVSVNDSTSSFNFEAGFHANNQGQIELERSVSNDNNWGLLVNANSGGLMSNSTFTNNDVGIQNDGALRTRSNNSNFGNAVPTDNQAGIVILSPI